MLEKVVKRHLDMWIEFSKLTNRDNFSETECVFRWNKMTKRNYSLGTLRFFAKKDSPEQYEDMLLEEQRQLNT